MSAQTKPSFAFEKKNYTLMLIGLGILTIGYTLMTGGGSPDPKVFDEESLFGARRTTIPATIVIVGYAFIIYAIMYRRKK
ncbi:MAG: DUF3098 domain-containing protein [Flavobacteriales bacterium]|jgi:hypothetical protein